MNAIPGVMVPQQTQTGVMDKLWRIVALALSIAVFLEVGWMVMQPDDPRGAVSFLSTRGSVLMALECLALSAAVAAVVTVMTGRTLANFGEFAVALSLALVSLRGSTSAYLLLRYAESTDAPNAAMAVRFLAESLVWSVVLAAAIGTSALVRRRLHKSPCDAPRDLHAGRTACVKHTLMAALLGLAAVQFFSTGLSSRAIEHGQACFVVAAAFAAATYTARRFVPLRSALWSVLAVPIVAMGGYAWAWVRPASEGLPLSVPSSHYLRILPIQFIAVGVAAVLATIWYFPSAAHADSGSDQT